ncbi:MAG: lipocalin family protein [Bacteroidales bacterium]|jgi:apolipoprotein D and lipocalin family protein|nr:lipocalin family protein [Bacteroidales bacterium]
MKKYRYMLLSLLLASLFLSCSTIPKGVEAVKDFEKTSYLGKWYEIARFDFKFEEGLNNTTAEYSVNEDGTIRVENRGFDYTEKTWEQAIGKAKFVGDDDVAMLKVSFFGPFYAGYNVIALDENYKYALVCGQSLKYLWFLSRETEIPENIKNEYLQLAEDLGFDTSELIWVEHDKANN